MQSVVVSVEGMRSVYCYARCLPNAAASLYSDYIRSFFMGLGLKVYRVGFKAAFCELHGA